MGNHKSGCPVFSADSWYFVLPEEHSGRGGFGARPGTAPNPGRLRQPQRLRHAAARLPRQRDPGPRHELV